MVEENGFSFIKELFLMLVILNIALGFVLVICPRRAQACPCGLGKEKYTAAPRPSGNGLCPVMKITRWLMSSASGMLNKNWFSET